MIENGPPSALHDHETRSIEDSLLLVATLDADLRIRRTTSAWSRVVMGESPLDTHFTALVAPDHVEAVRAALGRLAVTPETTFDARIRPDLWMRFRAQREPSGEVRLIGTDITDLKRANLKARDRIELLEAIIEHTSAGISVTARDGTYVLANAWFRGKTGVTDRDLRGANLFDEIPPGHKEAAMRTHEALFDGQPEAPRDWSAIDANGEQADLRVETALITLPSGAKYGLATLVDVTLSRKRDARVQLFSKVLESAPFVFWACDRDGAFTMAEGRGLAALGSPPGGWVGRNALEEWKGTPAHANMKRVLAGEELRDTIAFPGPIYYDAWYLPLRNTFGEVDGMLGLALDVTKERTTEAELREKLATIERQRERIDIFSHAINAAPVILSTIDTAGNFTLLEGKGLELVGVENGQSVGTNAFEVLQGTSVESAFRAALSGESSTVFYEAGPNVCFDNWFLPLRAKRDGQIVGAMSLGIDSSDRMRVERALRDKLELIEQQSATIRELATPILKLWDEVVCLPLIGTIDSRRTADILETFLQAIVTERVRFAVIDLTGVGVVDTTTADHLIRLFKAAKLLGAEGILCGIQPAVAHTVVALGTELGNVTTARTLSDALKWCIAHAKSEARTNRA